MRRIGFPTFSFHNTAHRIMVAMVAASFIFGLLKPWSTAYLSFVPYYVWSSFQIWRPFTALFVATDPMSVIFGALILYSIGGTLEQWWGKRRFLLVTLGFPLAGMAITLLVSIIIPSFALFPHTGAYSMVTAVWIVFGLMNEFSGQTLNFWGTMLRGKTFALIGLGCVLLSGALQSFMLVWPTLFTAAICYLYMYDRRMAKIIDRCELYMDQWKLRRLKAKRGLKLVRGNERGDEDDRDPKIH